MSLATPSRALGVIAQRASAARTNEQFHTKDYTAAQIRVLTRNPHSPVPASGRIGPGTHADTGSLWGLVMGAGFGGLIGLGLVTGVVPMIGPALAWGMLTTVLIGVLAGAGVGGIVGLLVGWGIRKEIGNYYENRVVVAMAQPVGRPQETPAMQNYDGELGRQTAPADRAFQGVRES